MGQPSFIQVGYIQGVFGIKGWLKAFSYCRPKEQIFDYLSWQLRFDNNEKLYQFEQGKQHGSSIIVKLAGTETRTEAEYLKRASIWVPISALAKLSEDEFYWYQLIGLQVENINGQRLGNVERLMETGANDVVVVANHTDQQQLLIPYVRGEVVIEINLDQNLMIVDWHIDY